MADEDFAGVMEKLTAEEALLLSNIFDMMEMEDQPKIDWDIVAQRADYKSGCIAKAHFVHVKKKFGLSDTENGAVTPITPTKPLGKKVKEVGSGSKTTPAKIKRNTRASPVTPKIRKSEVAKLQAAAQEFLQTSPLSTRSAMKSRIVYAGLDNEEQYSYSDSD